MDSQFLFSQHNLGDFVDCPRRFYLRYIARQAWPLIETGPNGMDPAQYLAYLRRGAILHRWIERYWLGIPVWGDDRRRTTDDGKQTADSELMLWWSRFLGTDFSDLPPQRLPELALVAGLGDYRLYARFDLLALPWRAEGESPGESKAVIVDWKTLRSENPPRHRFLRQRLQTRIYLYVLAAAGAAYNGGIPFEPEQCSMRYWLANFPEQLWVEIGYSPSEHEDDQRRLLGLVQDIARRDGEAQFPKTDDERKCAYCAYRTLCLRRGAPGADLPDEEGEAVIDPETVPELEY